MSAEPPKLNLHGRGALKLTILFGAAQAVPLLLSPALARLYAPEQIGQWAIFGALVAVGASAASLRFDQVVLVAGSRRRALQAALIALICAGACAIVVGAALLTSIREAVVSAFGERAKNWTGFLGFGVFLLAVALVASSWFLRNTRFVAVGMVRLGQASLVAVLGVAFGLAGVPQGLIVAQIGALMLTGATTGVMLSRDIFTARAPGCRRLYALAKRYREFPLKGAPANLLSTLAIFLPLLLFARIFGDFENGQFALARQCLLAASGVLSVATGQAFMLASTECVRSKRPLRDLLLRQFIRQCIIAGVFLIATLLLAQPLFELFFGDRWAPAGTYAIWLAAPVAAALLVSPMSGLLLAVERVGANSAWQVGYAVSLALLALPSYDGPIQFLIALLVVDVACYTIYLVLIVYGAREHDRALRRNEWAVPE